MRTYPTSTASRPAGRQIYPGRKEAMRAQPKHEMTIKSYNRRTPAGNKARSDMKLKTTDDFTVMKRFYSTAPGTHGTLTLELLDWHHAGYLFYAPEKDFILFGKERPITNA